MNYSDIPTTLTQLHKYLWANGFKGRLYRDKQGYVAVTKEKVYPLPYKTLKHAFYSGWLKLVMKGN